MEAEEALISDQEVSVFGSTKKARTRLLSHNAHTNKEPAPKVRDTSHWIRFY